MAVPHQLMVCTFFALLVAGCQAAGTRKIVIILGPPCAGCGTQSPNIVKALNIPHLDTGGMLRQASQAGTPNGLIAGKMMKEGVLVTDEIVNKIVQDRINQPDCAKGFLLDGYPRNTAQSLVLDKYLETNGDAVTDVLVLNVPMVGLQQCVMHRWTADGGDEWTSDYFAFRVPKSLRAGATANCQAGDLEHCNMWDDWTHEPLFRRADDNLKTLSERVKIYNAQTAPVIDHYKSQGVIRDVDAYQQERKVWADINKVLGAPAMPDLQVTGAGPSSLAETTGVSQLLTTASGFALVAAAATAAFVLVVFTRRRSSDMSEPLLEE